MAFLCLYMHFKISQHFSPLMCHLHQTDAKAGVSFKYWYFLLSLAHMAGEKDGSGSIQRQRETECEKKVKSFDRINRIGATARVGGMHNAKESTE